MSQKVIEVFEVVQRNRIKSLLVAAILGVFCYIWYDKLKSQLPELEFTEFTKKRPKNEDVHNMYLQEDLSERAIGQWENNLLSEIKKGLSWLLTFENDVKDAHEIYFNDGWTVIDPERVWKIPVESVSRMFDTYNQWIPVDQFTLVEHDGLMFINIDLKLLLQQMINHQAFMWDGIEKIWIASDMEGWYYNVPDLIKKILSWSLQQSWDATDEDSLNESASYAFLAYLIQILEVSIEEQKLSLADIYKSQLVDNIAGYDNFWNPLRSVSDSRRSVKLATLLERLSGNLLLEHITKTWAISFPYDAKTFTFLTNKIELAEWPANDILLMTWISLHTNKKIESSWLLVSSETFVDGLWNFQWNKKMNIWGSSDVVKISDVWKQEILMNRKSYSILKQWYNKLIRDDVLWCNFVLAHAIQTWIFLDKEKDLMQFQQLVYSHFDNDNDKMTKESISSYVKDFVASQKEIIDENILIVAETIKWYPSSQTDIQLLKSFSWRLRKAMADVWWWSAADYKKAENIPAWWVSDLLIVFIVKELEVLYWKENFEIEEAFKEAQNRVIDRFAPWQLAYAQ